MMVSTTLQVVPDDTLKYQICQECFGYLSTGPVSIDIQKKVICGKCSSHNVTETRKPLTMSLYNVLAEGFLFRCNNYLSGCEEKLCMADMKEHSPICNYKSRHECFFCSFSGSLLEVCNHCQKDHAENIVVDGKIDISFCDVTVTKTLLFLQHKCVLLIRLNVDAKLFDISFQIINKETNPNIIQYGMFFQYKDPLIQDKVINDFGIFNNASFGRFSKPMHQLKEYFGCGADVSCQIVLETPRIEGIELEIQKRYSELHREEEELTNSKILFEKDQQELQKKNHLYESAINIIKVMSYHLLKCLKCEKVFPTRMFYCPQMHSYCENCLIGVCTQCGIACQYQEMNYVQEFQVSCDWPECKETIKIKDYLVHKFHCLKRPYKCPLMNCSKVLISANALIKHWHSDMPKLYTTKDILFENYQTEDFYWLVNSNLYHVFVQFNDTTIQVLIDGVTEQLYQTSFFCKGGTRHLFEPIEYTNLPSSTLCGRFQVNMSNAVRVNDTKAQLNNGVPDNVFGRASSSLFSTPQQTFEFGFGQPVKNEPTKIQKSYTKYICLSLSGFM